MGTWPPQCRSRKHEVSFQVKGPVVSTPTPGSSASPCGPKSPRQTQTTLWPLWESGGWDPGPSGQGKSTDTNVLWGHPFWKVPSSSCPPECAGNKAERSPAPGSDGSPPQIACEGEGRKSPKMSLSGNRRVSRPPVCGRPDQGQEG